MRNIFKATTLESRLPILAVERECIISKDAEVTIAFRVELPEIFTLTAAEYEAICSMWVKAIKILPNYTIVHKQDWFIEEEGELPIAMGDESSLLDRSFARHFNERPYLGHTCYLFVTKTTKERSRTESNFSTLCRGHILPKEVRAEVFTQFFEAVGQFESIINDSGLVAISRLGESDIVGSCDSAGIIERYLTLSQGENPTLCDLTINPNEMTIGDKILSLHTLCQADDLPNVIESDSRYERLSTDRSDCRLSFSSPVGLLLSCNHIYNQYIFIDDAAENLRRFERSAKNLNSLSRFSRSNQINKEWIDEYLNDAHTFALTSVRLHANVIAWGSGSREQLRQIKNRVGSAIAMMGCKPRHNTIDLPTLYWAAMPGNGGDFPAEESFYSFIEQGVALFCEETNYRSSLSPFGIKMVDRLSGRPLHLDISDLPMKRGVITNRNKFVVGPSGSGKSFFMNHMVRQYYEQGTHVVLVDTGNSYEGLCDMINRKTKGEDGVYFTYTEESPISFNPFFTEGAPIMVA